MRSTLPFFFVLSFFTIGGAATCYFPNGDIVNDTPCNPGATHSTCCGPGYACLSNNVCALTEHVTPDIRKLSSYYVRASCTDKDWAAKECPSFCMNSQIGDNTGVGGMGVARCDANGGVDRYYCRNNQTANLSNDAICTNSSLYFEFQGFPTTMTIIGAGTQTTPVPASSSSPNSSSASAAATWTPSATPEAKNDSAVALGAGLGVGLGIPLLLAVVAVVLLWRRRRGAPQSAGNELHANGRVVETGGAAHTPQPRPTAEKYASRHMSRRLHEANGDYGTHEAETNTWVQAHELSAMEKETEFKEGVREWKAV